MIQQSLQENKVLVEIPTLLAWALNKSFDTIFPGTDKETGKDIDAEEKSTMAALMESDMLFLNQENQYVSLNSLFKTFYQLDVGEDVEIEFCVTPGAVPRLIQN
jgi:hypothetical protein